jgi:hypothetical protein
VKLKVGVREYRVVHCPEIVEVGGEYYGKHEIDKTTITIASKYSQLQQNESFLHELFHAITCMQDLRGINNDENAIDLLAKGLYLVIKDNPHIFSMADILPSGEA